MQGRRPGSEGATRAARHIVDTMKGIGLEPAGEGGAYTQNVPMRWVGVVPGFSLFSFADDAGKTRLKLGTAVVASSYGPAGESTFDAPLVFAGYGVTAPEQKWDDFGEIDVRGKVIVVLVGDPPVEDGRFGGKAMTYYGRWTYKFEKALELGAVGCLVVHEDAPASYGWNVVQASWTKKRFQVVNPDGSLPDALKLQGWLSAAAADRLAKRAGTSLKQWHKMAMQADFRAFDVGVRFRGALRTEEGRVEDVNIIGMVKGETKPSEAVLITAHWDHLGVKGPKGEKGVKDDQDRVFNGALDNASGTATMMGIAAEMVRRAEKGDRPKRSILFMAVTAEEQGLLGSQYYADHALLPLSSLAGVINIDSVNVWGRTRDVQVMGYGQSTLEDLLAGVVQKQARTVVPDQHPERGSYYRSDQFSFAKRGVPAIYFRGGKDMEKGGIDEGERLAKVKASHYHTVSDEFDPAWTFEGAIQDGEAMLDLARLVADEEDLPKWKPGSEFANVVR
ncbi:MAG: M28 family peptidase [Nannocystaceae bacterium]